jgi:uncharacterized protein
MKQARVRLYGELNDFLPVGKRGIPVDYFFDVSGSVKDMIEALGVPHTEIDLILVNGKSVDFSRPVQDGDLVSVYPLFRTIDIGPIVSVRPQRLRRIRFVLDIHLGRLAAYLRLLGFDSFYRNDFVDEDLARISSAEDRILLTRDRSLLKRAKISYGYFVRESDIRRQVLEVLRRFDLFDSIAPFRRCLRCNELLQLVPKESIRHKLPPRVERGYDEFHLCPTCGRIYWKGSHYERMHTFIAQVASG